MTRIVRALCASTLLVSLTACESGSGAGPVAETPTISGLTTSANTLSISSLDSQEIPVTVSRSGGYNGPINLSVAGLPAGVTATFSPSALGVDVQRSVLQLIATEAAAAGTYTLTVRATGTGVAERTSTISLTVTIPRFALSLGATAAVVNRDSSISVPVNITRTGGFTGALALSIENVPTDVIATLAPAQLESNVTSSVLTLSAPIYAALVARTLTIRAYSPLLPVQTVPLPLTVADAALPTFRVNVGTFLSLEPGTSIEGPVTLLRAGGFTGPVALTIDSLPDGLIATVTPGSIVGDAPATLRVSAPSGAPGNVYAFTLRASGSGVASRVVRAAVVVGTRAGFIIAANPVTVRRGASSNIAFTIERQGANIAGGLAADALPAGFTITGLPAAIPAGNFNSPATQGTATLAVASSVAPGTYWITLRGTAAEIRSVALVRVTVTD